MADFTINSLTATALSDTDTFLKSDTNGVLSKVPFSEIKSDIAEPTIYTIPVQSEGEVNLRITATNKIIVALMSSRTQAMLNADSAWHTFANAPQGFPEFNSLSMMNGNGLIKIRTSWVDGVKVLQYWSNITSGVGYYVMASGATIRAAD